MTCIPNWHSIDVSTSRLSIFDISTDFYRARWVDTDPQKIYISTGNDTDPDTVELCVGAILECTDNAHKPNPETFNADIMYDRTFLTLIDHYLNTDETTEAHFSASSFAGGKYYYTVIFAYDHIRLDVKYEFQGDITLKKALYGAIS